MIYVAAIIVLNGGISWILNGNEDSLRSNVTIERNVAHDEECWIYLNGIATG
jgi:hypothetical protein